jgi:acetate---CoA ligase (ADP-forming)
MRDRPVEAPASETAPAPGGTDGATAAKSVTLGFLLAPRSVAVIGVGRGPGGVGREIFDALLDGGFEGDVWPVNPQALEIAGHVAYKDIAALPGVPDLAIVAVPAAVVPDVIDACGEAGVPGAIVITAGFKETGPAGGALQRRIAESARSFGMRLLGPNCLGLIVPGNHLNASFAGPMVPAGSIGVITQSGALGTAILDWARGRGGLSGFVSLGNRADLSEADLLDAFAALPGTGVIAGYVESVVDGQRFVRVAREVTRRIPVVLLKAGRSEAGARAVSSHTGSLAGSDAAYDAAFLAAGILRAKDTEQLFGMAEAFAHQPLPKGPGVAIVTNAGGPAVMATDACERLGVSLASFDAGTIEALRGVLPEASAFYNPVDLLGDAGPERYAAALRILARDPGVHSLLVMLTPQTPTRPEEAARVIATVAAETGCTTLACFMGEDAVEPARRALAAAGVPAFRYPEPAVDALDALQRYRSLAQRPPVSPAAVDADRATVRRILDEAAAAHRPFVLEEQAFAIARAYGIATPRGRVARSRADAVRAANEIGYPVALKISSPDILHKTDIGGVELRIVDDRALSRAWDEILDRAQRRMPDAAVWGVFVQEMVRPGVEAIVGAERDPAFGPLVMFGLGGVFVEVLRDVVFRLAPLDTSEAEAMIQETKAYGLLRGIRGAGPADIASIADVLVRVSALVTDFPEIVELDINPLVVAQRDQGSVAADIRIGIGG